MSVPAEGMSRDDGPVHRQYPIECLIKKLRECEGEVRRLKRESTDRDLLEEQMSRHQHLAESILWKIGAIDERSTAFFEVQEALTLARQGKSHPTFDHRAPSRPHGLTARPIIEAHAAVVYQLWGIDHDERTKCLRGIEKVLKEAGFSPHSKSVIREWHGNCRSGQHEASVCFWALYQAYKSEREEALEALRASVSRARW